MRSITVTALIAPISFALLAGCSQNAGSTTATAGGARLLPASAHKQPGLIYSSSFGGNTVEYYLKGTGPNNPVAGTLSGSLANPQGMGVDRAGDLYVSNGNDKDVLVYAAGSTSPTGTLDDPNKFPDDVAVGSDGTVYVANGSGPIGGSGNVVVYAPGATSPTQTLDDKHFYHVIGVGLDARGNLWVSCNFAQAIGTGTVVEFKHGSTTPIETHIKLGYSGGIGFDRDGHLLVIDQEVPSLNVYDVRRRKPLTKLALPGASAYFAFNQSSKTLYLADYSLGEIDVFAYSPGGLKEVNKITNGITPSSDNMGIATTPAQRL